LQSEKQKFKVPFNGEPVILQGVPAFPWGYALMVVTPTKYRWKQRRIHVEAGQTKQITELFFVNPSQAEPHPIEFHHLPDKSYGERLLQILEASHIDENGWNELHPQNRACILNLCAKMQRETVEDGTTLIEFVESIDTTWLNIDHRERIYAIVRDDLLEALRSFPQVYDSVGGGMHEFPEGWIPVDDGPDSFKTWKDKAGNIQLTFASNSDNQFLADIDLDDHKGLKHIANVLEHKFTGKNTHPYDIHQTLWHSQQLDAEYELL
jgi:hypothetical protein